MAELSQATLAAIEAMFGRILDRLGPNPAGPVRPPADQGRWTIAINNFKRKLPIYTVGACSFTQFKLDFNLNARESGFVVQENADLEKARQDVLKGLMYGCLTGEAKKLAGRRSYPDDAECTPLTLADYARRLQNLFEPADESESARAEFRCRLQLRGENPLMYFTDKVTLFERAWKREQRDLPMLFDELTAGLLNELLRKEMRRLKVSNEQEYETELRFFTNSIRKQLLAGEISEQDAEGLDLHSATMSYLSQRNGAGPSVKAEPGVYAFSTQYKTKKRRCFHCQSVEHFVANCPRKDAGLPPSTNAVRAVDEDDEGTSADQVEEDLEDKNSDTEVLAINEKRRWKKPKNGFKKRVNFPISAERWTKTRNRQKLATVYRNGNGIQVVEGENDSAGSTSSDEVDETEKVHTITPNDPSEEGSDYLNKIDFLGL